MSPRELKNARKQLTLAVASHERLALATSKFFAERPFTMLAMPAEMESGSDVYRFRLVRRIPRRLERQTSRCLRSLRRLTSILGKRLPQDGTLCRVGALKIPLSGPIIIPGAVVDAVLELDGGHQMHGAAITAPVWDRHRQEVTVIPQDPHGGLRGHLGVRFQIEFANAKDLTGKSAVALLGTAIWEAGKLLDLVESAQAGHPYPAKAPRRAESDVRQNHPGS